MEPETLPQCDDVELEGDALYAVYGEAVREMVSPPFLRWNVWTKSLYLKKPKCTRVICRF